MLTTATNSTASAVLGSANRESTEAGPRTASQKSVANRSPHTSSVNGAKRRAAIDPRSE